MQLFRIDILTVPTLFKPPLFADERGWFSEVFNAERAARSGLPVVYVQDNHSLSVHSGTVRGLHFQAPPFAQGKLVRVLRGAILDFAVDIRVGSPSFGQHIAVELSAENRQQFYVPIGYAHGFVTTRPDTEVFYKVTNYYNKASDMGLRYDDPDLKLDWKLGNNSAILSDKDRLLPYFRSFESPFTHDGEPMRLRTVET